MGDRGLLLRVAWPVQTTRRAECRSVNTQPLLRHLDQSRTDIHRLATVINHLELSKNGTSRLGGTYGRWSWKATVRMFRRRLNASTAFHFCSSLAQYCVHTVSLPPACFECSVRFVRFLSEGGVGIVSQCENAALALQKNATFTCGSEELQLSQKAPQTFAEVSSES